MIKTPAIVVEQKLNHTSVSNIAVNRGYGLMHYYQSKRI
jgi:hypothetical protein